MTKSVSSRFAPDKNHYLDLCAILAVVIPFTVYMATLAPSVTFFDSGEFITASASLGSAHSPGYPLYLMYTNPFTWLPLGNIAFRVNMATAFSSSLACLGVYLLTIRLLKDEQLVDNPVFSMWIHKLAGLSAACAFAFTPRLWLQSNHDKPYPLLAFISAVIFYLVLLWRQHYKQGNERPAFIYAATFLAGMSMALHQSVVLLLPTWAVLIILTDWHMITRIKELILATAFALFGFAIHLYLPLRATQNPLLNWGDPKSSTQFLWHFLRRGYPSEPHLRDISLRWEQVKAFNVAHEFTLVGVLLVMFALFRLWKGQRDIVIAYLTGICVFLLIIAGYFNTPLEMIFLTEEFFTPLYLLSAVLIGVGLFYLLAFAFSNSHLPDKFGYSVYSVIAVMFFSLPIVMCVTNYYENDQHNNYIAFDYAANSLRSLPQNAVMFTWGDSGAFPLWYLQGVERMREDVDLPHTPHIVFDWYLDSLPRLFKGSNLRNFDIQSSGPEVGLRIAITDLIGTRPVYIDFSTRYSVVFTDFVPVQKGIVYRIRRINEPGGLPDTSVWENYNNRGIINKISFLDLDTGKAIMIYANSYLEAGEFLMGIGRMQEGRVMLEKAEQISPELKPAVQQVLMRFFGVR